MLRLHSQKEIIKVVSDQIGCPTSAGELAKVCWRIIGLKKKKKLPFILHWCDAGVADWFDIAVAVGELAKELDINKKGGTCISTMFQIIQPLLEDLNILLYSEYNFIRYISNTLEKKFKKYINRIQKFKKN